MHDKISRNACLIIFQNVQPVKQIWRTKIIIHKICYIKYLNLNSARQLKRSWVLFYWTRQPTWVVDKISELFFWATFDHMLLEGSSFFVTPCFNSPKGTNRLWNKDAIAQAFKDANGNYIFCPTQHDLVANVTPMTSSRSTIKDKIKVLAHLVIWSCISQHCYYSITLALIMTSKRIKHHHNGFQFEQGEITKDCIWHWLQCLTKSN